MLSHSRIWTAIDRFAARHKLSTSGLAKRAGLDPTAFNPSKRVSPDGRPRWPSTESIAKVLEATGSGIAEFLEIEPKPSPEAALKPLEVPVIGLAKAGAGGYFDDSGFPAGHGWDTVAVHHKIGEGAYALEVTGDSMEPLYRHGDIIVVSPAVPCRQGDRVVVRTRTGEVMAKTLHRQTPRHVELHSANPAHPPRQIKSGEIDWIARIVWASQ